MLPALHHDDPPPFPSSVARSPFTPAAPSGGCDLNPLALPSTPRSFLLPLPTLLDRHQVPQMSHLLTGHVGLSPPSNPRPPPSPSAIGRNVSRAGALRHEGQSNTHTSGLRGEGSSNIVACGQMAATSHHIVNNLLSHWACGTRCRARCMSEVHMCAVCGGRIPAVSFRKP